MKEVKGVKKEQLHAARRSKNIESKESSNERRAPSFAAGISPFTKSACQSAGNLDASLPPPHRELALSATHLADLQLCWMLASTMPAHNSSTIQFGTHFSFPQSTSILSTALSDTMFSTCCPMFGESPASAGSSIFLHNNCFSSPPALSFSTPNSTVNFRPPSNFIAGCAALPEPAATHNVFGFSNAKSTGFNSQPAPFGNSPFKSSTEGDGAKIGNLAFPSGKSPF
ncbi:hypothetical protein BT93_H2733 [Corymbia citriodora subsp. variegata]|nr:hypothetical protein BT93_H2733 [Corymbia citriodora subsp. variegata]